MASQELVVINKAGKKVGTHAVPADIFSAKVAVGLLHEVVRWQRAKKRAGTHAVKTRAEVSGGGVKPWKQKGTGRARAGSIRSPLWVGGGVAHGPKPHKYEFSINKKARKRALSSVLSARHADEKLLVVDDFGLTEIKTKNAVSLLQSIGIPAGAKVVFVVPEQSEALKKSVRNIPGVKTLPVSGLNVYDLIHTEYVVMQDSVVDDVVSRVAF